MTTLSTYIDIEGLRLYAPVGVSDIERRVGTHLELSMRLYYDATAAMASDTLSSALNYADVTAAACLAASRPAMLIEHVAAKVRDAITAGFPRIKGGRITVTKPHAPICAPTPRVSLTLEW